FESGWADWSASNGIWQIGAPTTGPGACIGGTTCAGTVLDGNYEADTDSRLEGASLQLPAIAPGDELQLRFWQWFAYGLGDSGTVEIAIFDEATQTFGAWTGVASEVTGSSVAWTQRLVDLTTHAGKRVRLGFFHAAANVVGGFDEGPGWFVDDICLVLPGGILSCFASQGGTTTTTVSTSTTITTATTTTTTSAPTTTVPTTTTTTNAGTTSTAPSTTTTTTSTTVTTATSPLPTTTLPPSCGNGTVDAGEQCDPAAAENACVGASQCNADCTCPGDPCHALPDAARCDDRNDCTDDDACRAGICAGTEKCRVELPDESPIPPRRPVVPVTIDGTPGSKCKATLFEAVGDAVRARVTEPAPSASGGAPRRLSATARGRIDDDGQLVLKLKLNRLAKRLLRKAGGKLEAEVEIVLQEEGGRKRLVKKLLALLRQ
ncbi:MAG TPA: hypothetical protein VKA21_05005, partial [Candidatus Binatia bacterium]|nr:hypothetical protein [Candidatus Binatia bacterium]